MNRILVTEGQGRFVESAYTCPETIDNGIIVKNIMTGICTSDIAMMQGNFGPLPLHMQGHEGLGQVINVGKNVFTDVKVGDYVATRGEPAYADYYPVREGEFVIVPEADPKYIVEPVACGINVVLGDIAELQGRSFSEDNPRLLILGTGFLAYVAYKTLQLHDVNYTIDVVGRSNIDLWAKEGVTLLDTPGQGYDVVIVLKDTNALETQGIVKANAVVIDAVERAISRKESGNLLWQACTTVRPSPRKELFIECMELAVEWIKDGKLNVDSFWTQAYNRNTEWQNAFADGANRPAGYSRGYIKWD